MKPPRMRISSGYQVECPCGATIDSYTREVCCMECRREFVCMPEKNAPPPAVLDVSKFTVHQRAAWGRLLRVEEGANAK